MGRKLVLGVDFDGSIVKHMYPDIGTEMPGAFAALKRFIAAGDRLILWTCRMPGYGLEAAIEYCKEHGVEFEAHNENVHDHDDVKSRKIYADLYLDDRMIGGFPGWNVIENEVNKLREIVSGLTPKEPMTDKLLDSIEKMKKENQRWHLYLEGSSQRVNTNYQLYKSRNTSSAILEATKMIEENNLWHYKNAVLITDTGYKYDLYMDRLKKVSGKQFCYCGRAIDSTNEDALTYSLCSEHLMDV